MRPITKIVNEVEKISATDLDMRLADWIAPTGKPVLALLTKADKLPYGQRIKAVAEVRRQTARAQHASGPTPPSGIVTLPRASATCSSVSVPTRPVSVTAPFDMSWMVVQSST